MGKAKVAKNEVILKVLILEDRLNMRIKLILKNDWVMYGYELRFRNCGI